jgi:hypothetical protein
LETLEYRHDIFFDILKNKQLYDVIKQASEYISDMYDLKMLGEQTYLSEMEKNFFAINEIDTQSK